MFALIEIDTKVEVKILCNCIMGQADGSIERMIRDFKLQWSVFWDVNRSPALMQDMLDQLAAHECVYKGEKTNALSMSFAKAKSAIAYILGEDEKAFADSRSTEAVQPGSNAPYVEYLTPGWVYTVEESGRIVVSEPCVWIVPEEG